MSENYLIHFGNKNSGRYPRGSGERPHQHDGYGKVGRKLKKKEIKSVAKDINNNSTEEFFTNLDKEYKKISDKRPDKRIKLFLRPEQDNKIHARAHDATVKKYLNKYGPTNMDKILKYADYKIGKDKVHNTLIFEPDKKYYRDPWTGHTYDMKYML